MKTKLWIATEVFYPDQISSAFYITKIAEKLSEKYEVNVLTNTPIGDFMPMPNINIHRLPIKYNKNNLWGRSIAFIYVSLRFSFFLLKNLHKNDLLLIITNPAPFVVLASLITKIKKNELKILVHDVFPENAIAAGIFKSKSSILFKILEQLFNKSYCAASKIVVCGRDMKEIFNSKIHNCSSIEVVTNWSEVDRLTPLYQTTDKIILQFAGNMGRVQGILELFEIIQDIKNPLLEFHFIGDGALRDTMTELINIKKLDSIKIYDSFHRNQQNDILNSCDIGIVTLADSMLGLGVPSKSYNLMSVGKPIFYIGPKNSEISRMIHDHGIGYNFEWSNREAIVTFLNHLRADHKSDFAKKGFNARVVAESHYSEKKVLDQYKSVI